MDLSRLPQLEGRTVGEDFDPRPFILETTTVAEAAATALLFWPEFVAYRDCVFLRFAFDRPIVDRWFGELNGDGRRVETVVNQVHLWDVFAAGSDAENDVLAELAARLGTMWKAAASAAFPDRGFTVTVAGEAEDYGPTLYLCTA